MVADFRRCLLSPDHDARPGIHECVPKTVIDRRRNRRRSVDGCRRVVGVTPGPSPATAPVATRRRSTATAGLRGDAGRPGSWWPTLPDGQQDIRVFAQQGIDPHTIRCKSPHPGKQTPVGQVHGGRLCPTVGRASESSRSRASTLTRSAARVPIRANRRRSATAVAARQVPGTRSPVASHEGCSLASSHARPIRGHDRSVGSLPRSS
jgi:hypothetical protein